MVSGPIDSPVQQGDVIDNKYVVDNVIGVGGMGVVVAARHAELGQRVALKFLLPHAAGVPGAVERFIREARSAVQLQSQHVARVYDVGRIEGGTPYLVMELLEGCDLGSLVKNSGPLRIGHVTEFVIQACEAVAEAHALGIVHRDLKPANLFLTRRVNGAPLVKVLDFGISKLTNLQPTDHSLTKTSDVVGSPYYMSPEQVRSAKDVDSRTDIWALGVILYELLAARVPFAAANVPQLCAMVLEEEPAPLHSVRADVPIELSQIVSKCLEKEPGDRFPGIQDLVRALAPFAGTNGGADDPVGIPMTGSPELPPLPVRSSLTMGETMQQDSRAGPNPISSPPDGPTASALAISSQPAQAVAVVALDRSGSAAGAQSATSETTPERSTEMTWDNEPVHLPIGRSWLFWAVPIVGVAAVVALVAAIWTLRRNSEATSASATDVSSAAPSAPVDSVTQPPTVADPTASTPVAAPAVDAAPPRPKASVTTSRPPETAAATTARPPATKTPTPPVKGGSTGTGEDFLPSDRK